MITVGIQIYCKHKRELFLLNRLLNNPALKRYYNKYCKILVKVIQEAKRLTFSTRISKSNNKTKTTWNIINELLGIHYSLNDVHQLTVEGTHYTNQQHIAEEFNKYFSTVVDIINSNKLVSPSINTSSPYNNLYHIEGNHYSPMIFKTFSTNEIISIIKSLKTKNSFGYDEISPKILKISANYISSPLPYICNKAISTGVFPDRLKYSLVTPIFRKGNNCEPASYRPILILTFRNLASYI